MRLPLHAKMLAGAGAGAGLGVLCFLLFGDDSRLDGFVRYVCSSCSSFP